VESHSSRSCTIILILFFAVSFANGDQPINLITNGNFEQAAASVDPAVGKTPIGWRRSFLTKVASSDPPKSLSTAVKTTNGRNGGHALAITLDQGDQWVYAETPIKLAYPLALRSEIDVSVWTKAPKPAKFSVYIEAWNAKTKAGSTARTYVDASSDWKQVHTKLIVGPEAVGLTDFRVLIQLRTPQVQLIVDDVRVTHTAFPDRATVYQRLVNKQRVLTLKGNERFIALDHPGLALINSPITLQAWFRTTTAHGIIFECGQQNRNPSAQAGYALYMKWGKLRFGVNNSAEMYSESLWDDATTNATYNDGQWHHVTGVFPADGKTRVSIYVDGQPVTQVSRVGQAQPGLTAYTHVKPLARIGSRTSAIDYPDPARYFWNGSLAEIRLYNRILDDDEIKSSMYKPAKLQSSGLVACWLGDSSNKHPEQTITDENGQYHGKVTPFIYQPPVKDPYFPVDPLVFPVDDFDYAKYPSNITGFTGQNLQRIALVNWSSATRVRVGERGFYKAGLTQRPNGTLVLATCRQHPDYKRDPSKRYFEIHAFESTDKGRTWQRIDQTPLVGKEPALATMPDGTMILTSQNLTQVPNSPAKRMMLYRSSDGGRSWDDIDIDTSDTPYPYPRDILVDKDGGLSFLYADQMDIALRRSKDGGKTWSNQIGKVDWDPKDMNATTLFAEVGICRISNGRLLATLRREIPGTEGEGFEDTYLTESVDDGASWARPWRVSGTAEVHAQLTELADGRLLMTWSNYHLPYGVAGAISTDGGHTWDREHTIQLSISADCYAGWAVSTQLDDASIVTAYATTPYLPQKDKPKTACEVVRWRCP